MIESSNAYFSKGQVFIVAEMSANHLQDIRRARDIILAAKEAGADAIKLQTYRPDTITLNCSGKEFEANPDSPWKGMNLYELYKTAYTPWEWHKELFEYASELGICCFSTPFDLTAIDFLESLNTPIYKIASFEINDIPLISKAAKTGKPLIISTGIADISDIALALETCRKNGNNNITLLKCISEYPTPYEEFNLKTMVNMKETFSCPAGLSDHSLGDEVAIAAAALGASLIEKHFTLSRKYGGPDALFSMEPDEFKTMVKKIRNVEKALGHITYDLTEKQLESKKGSRSLYIAEDIKAGETLTENNLKSVRPNYGLHTKYYFDILGKKVNRDLKKGTAMKFKYISEIDDM